MKFKLLLLFLFAANIAPAQTQFTGWFGNFSTFKVNKKFSIHFDGQVRSTDKIEHIATLLLRTGLNVHVKKNMTATAGYAFIHNRRVISGISGYAPEHRLWQQFIVSHPFFNTRLSHRFRVEQRFLSKSTIDNGAFKNEGNVYANRFRYFFRTLIPFKGGLQPTVNALYMALQNEAFVNFGDKSGVNGEIFDQNRACLAFGRRTSLLDIEIGYMNQYINGRGDAFTNNHILQLATYLRL